MSAPLRQLRRNLTSFLVDDVFFAGAAAIGRRVPAAQPARHGVVVEANVPYGPAAGQRADVWAPVATPESLPVVVYVHGGGFRKLSKDTHWLMALIFARRGYLVYNLDYRLGAANPYPAALEDCVAALRFVQQDAPRRGGDLSRLVLAGESAGGNLVTALSIAATYQHPEPWARQLFATGLTPRVAAPACGLLQVSDARRYDHASALTRDLVRMSAAAYLGDEHAAPSDARALADPLLFLERGHQPHRPLPAFFAGVGTLDPLQEDTRRLDVALETLGVAHETRTYRGGIHAFHGFIMAEQARRYWKDLFAFLAVHNALATAPQARAVGTMPA